MRSGALHAGDSASRAGIRWTAHPKAAPDMMKAKVSALIARIRQNHRNGWSN